MKDNTKDILNKIDNKPQDKLYYQNQISPNQLNRIHLKQLTENDKLRLRVQELERENQILRNYIQEINNKKLIKEQEFRRAQQIIKKNTRIRTNNQSKETIIIKLCLKCVLKNRFSSFYV